MGDSLLVKFPDLIGRHGLRTFFTPGSVLIEERVRRQLRQFFGDHDLNSQILPALKRPNGGRDQDFDRNGPGRLKIDHRASMADESFIPRASFCKRSVGGSCRIMAENLDKPIKARLSKEDIMISSGDRKKGLSARMEADKELETTRIIDDFLMARKDIPSFVGKINGKEKTALLKRRFFTPRTCRVRKN